jgi:hypothetical protein
MPNYEVWLSRTEEHCITVGAPTEEDARVKAFDLVNGPEGYGWVVDEVVEDYA